MVEKRFEGSPAILLRIFDLPAKLTGRAPNKHHLVLGGGKTPLWIAGREVGTRNICRLMARIAAHPVHAVPIFAALYVLKMHVAVITLKGRIARGVTVLAARRSQDIDKPEEMRCATYSRLVWLDELQGKPPAKPQRPRTQGRRAGELLPGHVLSGCVFYLPWTYS